jgi:hypothetical protein
LGLERDVGLVLASLFHFEIPKRDPARKNATPDFDWLGLGKFFAFSEQRNIRKIKQNSKYFIQIVSPCFIQKNPVRHSSFLKACPLS